MARPARRALTRTVAVSCLLAGAALAFGAAAAPVAGAQDVDAARPSARTDVVQVDGLIDPANAALITRSLREADEAGSGLIVFQFDATGSVDVDVDAIVAAMRESPVPTAVWVGPSGADAKGAAALLTFT